LSTCTQTDTKRHSEAKRHTVKIFHYKYAKKIIGSFLDLLAGGHKLFSSLPQIFGSCHHVLYDVRRMLQTSSNICTPHN